jgi:homoserine O-acetyltransferase
MSEIALEAWGDHEALILKPPRSPLSIPPPRPGFWTTWGWRR